MLKQDCGFPFDGLASGVGVLEACQRRTGSQGLLGIGGAVREDRTERIVAAARGVVAVGATGQDLIDLLGEQSAFGRVDELGGAGIGQALGEVVEDAQGAFQGTDLQQTGVGDVGQGKVICRCRDQELEPPWVSKLLGKYSLDTA